jgi:hypothetical protein
MSIGKTMRHGFVQQMLKEVVDVLLIRSKFPTPTCFGIWLPSLGGRECLINYSSNVLCYGRVRIMIRPVWPVVVVSQLATRDGL